MPAPPARSLNKKEEASPWQPLREMCQLSRNDHFPLDVHQDSIRSSFTLSSPSMIKGTNLTILASICLWNKHVPGQSMQERLKVITLHVIQSGRCIVQTVHQTVWQSLFTASTAEKWGHGRTSGLVGWILGYYSPAAASVHSLLLLLGNQQHKSALFSKVLLKSHSAQKKD